MKNLIAIAFVFICMPLFGQVGIGTTSPTASLTIQESGTARLLGFNNNGGTLEWHAQIQGSGENNLGFTESGVADHRLVLRQGGNIGVGNATPLASLTIQQTGSPRLLGFNNTSGALKWHTQIQGSGEENLGFTESGVADNRLVLREGGNVGVGTATPSASFTIQSTGSARLLGFNDTSGNLEWNMSLQGTGGEDLGFTESGIAGNRLVLKAGGNVGVGTATPTAMLTLERNNNDRLLGFNDGFGNLEWYTELQGSSEGDLAFIENGTATPRLSLEENGNVGVGTGAADCSFTIQETGTNRLLGFKDNGGETEWYMRLQGTGEGDLGFVERNVATNRLVLQAGGNVGIGTATPNRGKLHVSGSNLTNSTGFTGRFFLNNLPLVGLTPDLVLDTPGNRNVSIYATQSILAQDFVAFSDKRIKNIEGHTNNEEDLATIKNIEIVNYTLKDTITNGKRAFKKVVAQQLKEVYPMAVRDNGVEVLPNIFEHASIENGWIYTPKAKNINVGDNIRLIFPKKDEILSVLAVEKGKFRVESLATGPVFVYGTEVHDFHSVDYEAVAMLNVSATQALLQRIENLETELSEKEKIYSDTFEAQASRLEKIEELLSISTTISAEN